jgi:hypothetical protein
MASALLECGDLYAPNTSRCGRLGALKRHFVIAVLALQFWFLSDMMNYLQSKMERNQDSSTLIIQEEKPKRVCNAVNCSK